MRFRTAALLISMQLAPASLQPENELWAATPLTVNEALAVAEKQNRPLLIEFWAAWCGYCKELQKTLAERRFKEVLENFVVVRIDHDKEPTLVKHYSVETLPTVLVVDHSGSVLSRSAGQIRAQSLYKRLENVEAGYRGFLALQDRDDTSSQIARADYLLRSGNPDRAIQIYEETMKLLPEDSSERDQIAYACALAYYSAGRIAVSTQRLQTIAEESDSPQLRREASASLKTIRSQHQ